MATVETHETQRPHGRFAEPRCVRDFEALVRAVAKVSKTKGAGRDGFSPTTLGSTPGQHRRQAAAIAAMLEGDRVRPSECCGPRNKPVPTVLDRVVGSYIVAELAHVVQQVPEGVRGLRPGEPFVDVLHEVATIAGGFRDGWAVLGDVTGCFESIRAAKALEALEQYGCPRWVRRYLKAFYRRNKRFPGLVRGFPLAPLLAALWLRPLDALAARSSRWWLRYGDDFAVVFDTKEEAERFLGEARALLMKLGLHLHEAGPKAARVVALRDAFTFLGLSFDRGRAHPPAAKVDALVAALDEGSRKGAPLLPILEGRTATWTVCPESPAIWDLTWRLRARFRGLPLLGPMVEQAAKRATLRRASRLDRARSGVERPRRRTSQPPALPSGSSHVRELPPMAASPEQSGDGTALGPMPEHVGESVAAGALAPPPRLDVDARFWALDDPPTDAQPIEAGFVRRAVRRNGFDFIHIADHLATIRGERTYRRLGFETWEAFALVHLREDAGFLDRVILVGLSALDIFATGGRETVDFGFRRRRDVYEVEHRWLPVTLLNALASCRGLALHELQWPKTQLAWFLFEVATGDITAREAVRSVRRSHRRATEQAVRRGRGQPAARVYWEARTRNGRMIDNDFQDPHVSKVAAAQVRCVAILAALDTADLFGVLSQGADVPSSLDQRPSSWATAWTALVEAVAR